MAALKKKVTKKKAARRTTTTTNNKPKPSHSTRNGRVTLSYKLVGRNAFPDGGMCFIGDGITQGARYYARCGCNELTISSLGPANLTNAQRCRILAESFAAHADYLDQKMKDKKLADAALALTPAKRKAIEAILLGTNK